MHTDSDVQKIQDQWIVIHNIAQNRIDIQYCFQNKEYKGSIDISPAMNVNKVLQQLSDGRAVIKKMTDGAINIQVLAVTSRLRSSQAMQIQCLKQEVKELKEKICVLEEKISFQENQGNTSNSKWQPVDLNNKTEKFDRQKYTYRVYTANWQYLVTIVDQNTLYVFDGRSIPHYIKYNDKKFCIRTSDNNRNEITRIQRKRQ